MAATKPKDEATQFAALHVSQTINDNVDPADDGVDGLEAWLVVLGAFLANIAVLGLLYSFGIFLVPIATEFNVSRSQVALVGTINIACFYFAGIFAGPLSERFGVRKVMCTGII